MEKKPGKILIVIFILITVFAGLALLFLAANKSDNKSNSQNSSGFADQYGRGCKDQPVNFTHTPVALENISFIFPLGRMADAHVTPTDHAYIAPLNPAAPEGAYDLVSPADGEVVSVQAMPADLVGDNKNNFVRPPEDNRIIVRFSCRYYAIFIHAHQLAPKVQKAVGKLKPNQASSVNIPVLAGEPIAKLSGKWLDWSMNDTKSTLSGFITPSLYNSEPWKIHTIDPFSVYSEKIKAKFAALSLRNVAPFGGKIDYDQSGAAIGNWFKQGSGGFAEKFGGRFWDSHLAIAPDPVDPAKITFSFGNWQGQSGQFIAQTNIDPASVTTASGEIKVELAEPDGYVQANGQTWDMRTPQPVKPLSLRLFPRVAGTVVLQVLPGEKLRLEKFPGKTAGQVSGFTAAAEIFER